MRYSILTAALLAVGGATAQTGADNVKFTKVSSPVTSTSSSGNPQYQFYHAQYTGAAWGDVNNDGYPDLFYSDRNTHINNSTVQVNLYYNNGDGTFKRGGKGRLQGTAFSAPVWIDIDNDGNLDLLVAGLDDYNYRWRMADTDLSQIGAHLYRHTSVGSTGAVTFTEVNGHGIRPIFNGKDGGKGHNWIATGDYDNDGLTDVVMTGFDEAARLASGDPVEAFRVVYLYRNNGDGSFTLQEHPLEGSAPFHGLTDGSVVLEDLDNDGFVDLLTTGYGSSRTSETYLYWNNGDGTFTEHTGKFSPVTNASSTVADLDNDGLADIILSGYYLNTNTKRFYICRNLGNRQFEALPLDQLEGCDGTQIAVGDVNNDGYPDILAGGHFATNEHSTLLYVNKGNMQFESYGAHFDDPFGKKGHFSRITHGAHHLVDVDRDGSLDAWFSGWSAGECSNGCSTELWRNAGAEKGQAPNMAPDAPTGLNASINGNTVTLSWDAPTDDTTPAEALRYNIFIRDTETGRILSTLPADITTGYIKVTDTHGAIRRRSHTLQLPADGKYQWGVQAIDAANQGGAFATSSLDIAGIDSVTADEETVTATGGDGCIRILAPDGSCAAILTPDGRLTARVTVEGPTSLGAAPGIYIVTVTADKGNRSFKVVVR